VLGDIRVRFIGKRSVKAKKAEKGGKKAERRVDNMQLLNRLFEKQITKRRGKGTERRVGSKHLIEEDI
jgi:hypothetical protein